MTGTNALADFAAASVTTEKSFGTDVRMIAIWSNRADTVVAMFRFRLYKHLLSSLTDSGAE